MNSVCILVISTFLITGQTKDLTESITLDADKSICRIIKSMSGKEISNGMSIIRKEMTCECSLPDKNSVMIPTFVGQSKRVVRY